MSGENAKRAMLVVAASALAGCFTVSESPFPKAEMSRPSETNATVRIQGFDARVIEYVSVTGVTSVYVDPWHADPWCGPGYWSTVPVNATVARPRETDLFRERARERFETAGWPVMAQVPAYVVEVKFSEQAESGSFWKRALRVVGTLFFSDRAELTCHAKLKVYDNRTGKLLFSRDYDQSDEESMWSPVLVLGPMSYDKTSHEYMRMRCHYALTDRATADASAYLAGQLR